MKRETRADLAQKLYDSKLEDLKASPDGQTLIFYGRMSDGRYFAARADFEGDVSWAPDLKAKGMQAVNPLFLTVHYCKTLDEAFWYDARNWMLIHAFRVFKERLGVA